MRDRFEDFIREHSAEFDTYEPSNDLWDSIDKNISSKKTIKVNWKKVGYRIASVAAIFIISFFVQKMFFFNPVQQVAEQSEISIEIPELIEAETYYSSIINSKLNEVKPILENHPILEEELKIDMEELENNYESLKKDLKDNIANHEVLEAMLHNYRLRVQILEEMIGYLNEKEDIHENINQHEI